MAAAVTAGAVRRRPALLVAAMLLLGGVMVGFGPTLGVARSYDGSTVGIAAGAVWVVLLPGITAVLISGWKPILGLAVSAGAGMLVLARVVADVSLWTGINTAFRPELFYELSDGALPFRAGPGVAMVVGGDVVMLAAGVMAARLLTANLSLQTESNFLIGRSEDEGPPGSRPERNTWVILAGFLGILGLLIVSLSLPYRGGYLAARYLPAELDLLGLTAALIAAAVATIAVLACAVLPRQMSSALLGGVAIAAAMPLLTAIAARLSSAPVQLNPIIWVGLSAAIVLAAAALFSRVRLIQQDERDLSSTAVRTRNIVGAALSVATGVAGLVSWLLPQLRFNGGAVPTISSGLGISAPQSSPFLYAAIPPLVGGVLWLIPAVARAGRAVSAVGWLGLVLAVGQSLDVLGQLITSASVPNAGFALPTWSAGPGMWWGASAIVLGVATLVLSVTSSRQAADASPLVEDEMSFSRARSIGVVVASVMTVFVVIALALPVYRTEKGASATLLVGFQVNSWGVVALAVGAIWAAWAAGRTSHTSTALAYCLAAAGLLTVRLVIPAALRAEDGFVLQTGFYVGFAAVAACIVSAGVLARSTRKVRLTDLGQRFSAQAKQSVGSPAVVRVAKGARVMTVGSPRSGKPSKPAKRRS